MVSGVYLEALFTVIMKDKKTPRRTHKHNSETHCKKVRLVRWMIIGTLKVIRTMDRFRPVHVVE